METELPAKIVADLAKAQEASALVGAGLLEAAKSYHNTVTHYRLRWFFRSLDIFA